MLLQMRCGLAAAHRLLFFCFLLATAPDCIHFAGSAIFRRDASNVSG
jgi:hypothetical protein